MSEKLDIKQFKLTNDDEILCEVIHWDDDEGTVIIKGAVRIINIEDFSRGVRFYSFKPWIMFQDDPNEVSLLNVGHIIVEATPTKEVLKHYHKTLKEIRKQLDERTKKRSFPLEKVAGKMDEMSEEEFESYMDDLVTEEYDDDYQMLDSDSPANVIKFKPKGGTFH